MSGTFVLFVIFVVKIVLSGTFEFFVFFVVKMPG